MAHSQDVRQSGERIEQLLEEIRAMTGRPAWQRIEELMRTVVELYGTGLTRIIDLVSSDVAIQEFRSALLKDELVSSLLILHGIHPKDVETRIKSALDRVRPYLGSHGGDIQLLEVNETSGIAKLRLAGSCDGCGSSMITVKLAVEDAILQMAPEVRSIEVEGMVSEPSSAERVISKGPPNGNNGHNKLPSWMPFDQDTPQNAGELMTAEVVGEEIVLCRIGKRLYAYRGICPSCGSSIAGSSLDGEVLSCGSCNERYNVRFAGRSLGRHELHLEPVPLLENEAGVKIAFPGVAL